MLARKATEAAAGLPAGAAQPAAPAPEAPTPQGLFNAVASLPGFSDAHLQMLCGIWEALQLQPRPAVAVQVPTSPVLSPGTAPALVADVPPAGEGVPAAGDGAANAAPPAPEAPALSLVGEDAAAGLEERLQAAPAEDTPAPMETTTAASGSGANGFLAALDEERAAKKGRKKL